MNVLNLIQSAFGKLFDWIGSGRREADIIVPIQNAIGDRLAEIVASYPYANVAQLQSYYNELVQIADQFTKFVHDPSFTDGRASQQALDAIMPLIDDNLNKIAARIYMQGGELPPPLVTQGYGSGIPSLRYPTQSYPYLPQAGTIPPNAPLSPLRQQQVEVIGAGSSLLPMILFAGVAFALLRRNQ